FPDGDAQLGDALSAAPSALGFVLEPSGPGTPLPFTPVLLSTPLAIPDAWRADGVIGPEPRLAAGAQGFGGLVMAADFDGRIRRVPLLVVAGRALRPGLAVEAVRLAQAASALLIQGDGRLRVGDVVVPLGPDASLRLVQRPMSAWASRTISLSSLLDGSTPPAALAGHIVLIGSSAPELGGLRVTPASPVTPSVQIQAEAISTLLRGHVAFRPAWLDAAETLAAVCLGLLGALFAHRLRPASAATLATLLCVGWSIAALVAVPAFGWLVDPAGPGLLALLIYGLSALVGFVGFEWRARRLRVRFEQHLSPEVVRRIAADPAALRLTGELREVSTLFTDIEGFTPMTERADPAELVALLDAYFEAVTSVVTANGGMVDKIVGDAVHALFNVPLPLTDHAARAVSCASEILDATEAVRRSTLGRRLMLGRTRIGVETGTAIVGDVGGARKLDYTALGNPINTAARLEQANKELGSSICIGPGTAARIDPALLQPLAILTVRGQSQPIQVFTPARPG
ncbi:MAG: adenylate/guanylate cyclase domain-containing protein, partial [Acetobacteraceae bacterium]|nr:adenylate/guanylate cyclase domain-containing protein [Acetobacteraceae bacterium]